MAKSPHTDWFVSVAGSYSVYPTNPVSVTGGSGSGATFTLNFPSPDFYLDVTSPSSPILYICTAAGSNSTSAWAQMGGSSSGMQQFQIISDGGDYWVCKTWDGTTLGTVAQNVIKPFKLRAGANAVTSETIRAVTYTYSYAAVTVGSVTGYYTRSVSGSDGTSETDVVIPDPLANNIIYAMPCTTNILSGVPVTIAAATMVSPGTGGTFVANDVLSVAGGTGTAATIKVLTVAAGKIATYQLLTGGNYSVAPSLTANAVTGGGGTGATFNLTLAPQLLDINADGRAYTK